ncbi:MAG: hypothetical protein WCQ47_08060 [bacterium]
MDKRYLKVLDFYRSYLQNIIDILKKEGVRSIVFSFTMLFLSIIFAFFTLAEGIRQAGAVVLLMAICDIMATLLNTKKLIESIIGKYTEVIFYTAVIVMSMQVEHTITAMFTFIAFIGVIMSSFIVSKAKEFDIDLDWGYIRRPERMFLMAIGMFFNFTGLMIASMLVAVAANAVAVHFVWNIWFDKKEAK